MVKTIFMGADPIALPLLETLLAHPEIDLCAVLTQPDRPSGRGKKLSPNPIKAWATTNGLEIRAPEKPSDAEIEWLQGLGIKLSLVMAYGHILRKSLLHSPPLGTWNFHASILPKHRGASPIESAILAGEQQTGVSLMQIVPKMDAGPVLDVEKVPITSEDTSPSLREKLSLACKPLLLRNIQKLLAGNLAPLPQDASAATYCTKISKNHGQIDFTQPAAQLERQTRAYFPWPGTYFDFNGTLIKVAKAKVVPSSGQPHGTVLSADKSGLTIETPDGAIQFHQLQRPGGKMLPAETFFLGFQIPIGLVLP
jgi:methionyl-tRNA formyltransferase